MAEQALTASRCHRLWRPSDVRMFDRRTLVFVSPPEGQGGSAAQINPDRSSLRALSDPDFVEVHVRHCFRDNLQGRCSWSQGSTRRRSSSSACGRQNSSWRRARLSRKSRSRLSKPTRRNNRSSWFANERPVLGSTSRNFVAASNQIGAMPHLFVG